MNRFAKTLFPVAVGIAWALCSVAPLWRYLSPTKAAIATILGLISVALGMGWLKRLNQRARPISLGWFFLLFATLTAAFAVLYPISLKHTLNSGSDREDALRIECIAIGHHQYPYGQRTFLGNPPTPLPGAILLAAPFFALGHIGLQNFLWLALFFAFTLNYFRHRATALFFLVIFLLLVPGNLSDFTSGGDYITNFFYIAIAVALFLKSLDRPLRYSLLAALFLGVALSSRIVYIFLLVPLLVLILQRIPRTRAALLFAVVLATGAAITLPTFMPHPVPHLLQQLSQNAGKLRYLPPSLHPQVALTFIASAVACIACFLRMDLPRLFLIFSIASFVILTPPIVTIAFHMGKLPYEFSYLAISVLPFALWALARYEQLPNNA